MGEKSTSLTVAQARLRQFHLHRKRNVRVQRIIGVENMSLNHWLTCKENEPTLLHRWAHTFIVENSAIANGKTRAHDLVYTQTRREIWREDMKGELSPI